MRGNTWNRSQNRNDSHNQELRFLNAFTHLQNSCFDLRNSSGQKQKIINKNQMEVWTKDTLFVYVRYAWVVHPVYDLVSRVELPLIPFRTDDFPVLTEGK